MSRLLHEREKRLQRNELARLYHWKQRNLLAPLNICKREWLLLDSRVVDVPLVYNLAFAMLSALKLLFFKSLKNALRVSENTEA
jgi:hypothetical protein